MTQVLCQRERVSPAPKVGLGLGETCSYWYLVLHISHDKASLRIYTIT